MKKNKLKNYLKFGIILFGVSISLINCQQDDLATINDPNSENNSELIVEKLSIREMLAKEDLQKPLGKLSNKFDFNKSKSKVGKNSSNSKIDSNDGSFTILTDEVIMVTKDSIKTYSFLIEEPTDPYSKFENFVLTQTEENIFKYFIYRYIENAINDEYPYSISIEEIAEDQVDIIEFMDYTTAYIMYDAESDCLYNITQSGCCTIVEVLWCGGGGGGSSSSGGSSGSGSTGSGGTTSSGDGGYGGDSGSGETGGGGGGGSSSSGDSSTSDDSGINTGPVPVGINEPSIDKEIAYEINNLLSEDPIKLLDIDCSQIGYWQELVQHIPPQSVLERINDLDDEHTTLFTDYEIQNLNNSYGKVINLDYFPVNVTTLPTNPDTGIQFTADEFLEYIRTNINSFVDPFWAEFFPIVYEDNSFLNSFSIDDTELWLSNNPLGAIIHIEIPADEGTVICTDYSNMNWTFTTIEVPWDDEHPVSGNRDFGYELNSDGSYTFFTRGVDRMTDAYDYIIEIAEDIIEDTSGSPTDFDLFAMTTDPLWESFQNKISEFVNNPANFGNATILEPSKNRPDWVLVKEVLNGERPISDLGCE